MSDAYRRYVAIKRSLRQCYAHLRGHMERRWETLVRLVNGIIGSRHVHLSKIADHTPAFGRQQESVIMRFRRWLQNPYVTWETLMQPVAEALLQRLAAVGPLVLVIDTVPLGHERLALVLSVVYHRRALPLVWACRRQGKGHVPEALHRALLARLAPLIPPGATVYILGDGEFDGIRWLADIQQRGWYYVCRTAPTILMEAFGYRFPIGQVALSPQEGWYCPEAYITRARYGPVMVIGYWPPEQEAPLYLVTNLASPEEALRWYKQRALIETLFSDAKTRGFHLQASHLLHPERLERLFIAVALAYIWLVYLGMHALAEPWRRRIHRAHRCDLSLFQLGLRLLGYCLKEGLSIPSGFLPPPGPIATSV